MSILHSPQAPGLRLFNMQESPKVETFGPALNQVGRRNYLEVFSSQRITIQTHDLVQALHMTADQVCKQQEMDHQHQVSFCPENAIAYYFILATDVAHGDGSCPPAHLGLGSPAGTLPWIRCPGFPGQRGGDDKDEADRGGAGCGHGGGGRADDGLHLQHQGHPGSGQFTEVKACCSPPPSLSPPHQERHTPQPKNCRSRTKDRRQF